MSSSERPEKHNTNTECKIPSAGVPGRRDFLCRKGGLRTAETGAFCCGSFTFRIREKNRHHSRTFLQAASAEFAEISHSRKIHFAIISHSLHRRFTIFSHSKSDALPKKLRSKCGQTRKEKPGKPCAARLSGFCAVTPTRWCRRAWASGRRAHGSHREPQM